MDKNWLIPRIFAYAKMKDEGRAMFIVSAEFKNAYAPIQPVDIEYVICVHTVHIKHSECIQSYV